jgi:hypothetical protein
MRPISKKKKTCYTNKSAGGVVQDVGPEIKPHHCKSKMNVRPYPKNNHGIKGLGCHSSGRPLA